MLDIYCMKVAYSSIHCFWGHLSGKLEGKQVEKGRKCRTEGRTEGRMGYWVWWDGKQVQEGVADREWLGGSSGQWVSDGYRGERSLKKRWSPFCSGSFNATALPSFYRITLSRAARKMCWRWHQGFFSCPPWSFILALCRFIAVR